MRMRSGTAVAGVAALAVAGMALTAALEPVWAHGPTRQKVRESIEINAAPAKVWAVIGNFQDMSWLPPVTKTEGDKGKLPDWFEGTVGATEPNSPGGENES